MDADILIRLFLRFILVPLGAAAAAAAGVAVMVVSHHQALDALLLQQATNLDPNDKDYIAILVIAEALLVVMTLAIWTFYAFVPALIGVVISEALAIRSWIYHAANGGVATWIGWALTKDVREEARFLINPGPLIAAGLLAGLAYWLVAGRTAGFWRRAAVPAGKKPPLAPTNGENLGSGP